MRQTSDCRSDFSRDHGEGRRTSSTDRRLLHLPDMSIDRKPSWSSDQPPSRLKPPHSGARHCGEPRIVGATSVAIMRQTSDCRSDFSRDHGEGRRTNSTDRRLLHLPDMSIDRNRHGAAISRRRGSSRHIPGPGTAVNVDYGNYWTSRILTSKCRVLPASG